MSMRFRSGRMVYILTGKVMSVYTTKGVKVWAKFFKSVDEAREEFLALL